MLELERQHWHFHVYSQNFPWFRQTHFDDRVYNAKEEVAILGVRQGLHQDSMRVHGIETLLGPFDGLAEEHSLAVRGPVLDFVGDLAHEIVWLLLLLGLVAQRLVELAPGALQLSRFDFEFHSRVWTIIG
jgi:hypothetical protein